MSPRFGTSGLRGLVTDLTPGLVTDYTRAFLASCPVGTGVYLGRDLRPSSPAIAGMVAETARAAGLDVTDCGTLPTPALALAAMDAGAAAVMVTGSHIPADRNGLKFYRPDGEISKADETAILAALGAAPPPPAPAPGALHADPGAGARHVARCAVAFGPGALAGLRIGVHEHSSVARDMMGDALRALGAEAVPLARSETFIPVDTEAVDPATRDRLAVWVRTHALDAVVSTDGDGDRPMLADHAGRIVPGDVLGPLTARAIGADHLCTPVSSNSLVEAMADFACIERTRIGSPFVIEAMQAALARDPAARVAGYEANGGFLLGFAARGPAGPLAPLMTRDSLLPMLAPLALAHSTGQRLADLVAALPARFTATDRIAGIATAAAVALLTGLIEGRETRAAFFAVLETDLGIGPETAVDLTDGLRVTFQGGDILHLRPSGNAPEFRCYAESATPERATRLLEVCLMRLREGLDPG